MWLLPDRGLSRGRYFIAGVLLTAVKWGIDLVVSRAFSKPYSPLIYINLPESPVTNPEVDPTYWLVLWAISLPFIAIGIVLTIWRLRDAGLSPLFTLLFFAPALNLLLFLICSLAPSAKREPDGASGGSPRALRRHAALKAAAGGLVVGLVTLGVGMAGVNSYGAAALIGAPFVSGFMSGYLYSRWDRPSLAGALGSASLSLMLVGAVVVAFAVEGLVCLAMASPLVLSGALMGAAIGCLTQRFSRGGAAPTATALALLPLGFTLEAIHPLPVTDPRPVESSILIDAPVEEVWRQVIAFPPLPPPDDWIFRMGIAAPVGATIKGEGVGAIRRCHFTTGSFIEPIEVWDPPRELTFRVTASPDPMRELTLWPGPRPPHLDGFLESTRGQFLLEPLPGGGTRLTGRTWYRTNMVPETYWRLWADPIIHTIHMRVLRHVAALAETQDPPTPSRPDTESPPAPECPDPRASGSRRR